MEPLQTIDDLEIQKKVESLAGKGTRVLDCEKSTSFQTEEVLLVNGFPVPLNGEEGIKIKQALMTGQVPPCKLLNDILIRAGILKSPVELETTMNIKSTTKTTELLTLRDKNGTLVDEQLKETEEDNEVKSTSTEVWKQAPNLHLLNAKLTTDQVDCATSQFGKSLTFAASAVNDDCASIKLNGSERSPSSNTNSPQCRRSSENASARSSPHQQFQNQHILHLGGSTGSSSGHSTGSGSTNGRCNSHSSQSSFSSGISEASGCSSSSARASVSFFARKKLLYGIGMHFFWLLVTVTSLFVGYMI